MTAKSGRSGEDESPRPDPAPEVRLRSEAGQRLGPNEPATHAAADARFVTESESRLDALLERAVALRASDVLLVAGFPPSFRVHGKLVPDGEEERLTGEDTRAFARMLLDEIHYREFLRDKASDFIVERPSIGRFRCDLHHQQGTVAVAVRVMPGAVPTLSDLHLPSALSRFANLHRGLVLFCGPTGSGKSTTMAALIEIVNQSRAVHIVTIEDPVEYLYGRGRAVVEQIEIARDAASFSTALRHALRQDPDVLLVGEMRDLESISIALSAAETGHLVFSTLHTGDAPQTIDRLIDAFPDTQQNQVRQQLSLCLAGVVVQTLVPSVDGGTRYPAVEILIANDPVRNLIRTGKGHLLYSQMTVSRKDGMTTMEDSLAAARAPAVSAGSAREAVSFATGPSLFDRARSDSRRVENAGSARLTSTEITRDQLDILVDRVILAITHARGGFDEGRRPAGRRSV